MGAIILVGVRISPARRLILLLAAVWASMYPFAGLTDDVSMDRGGIVIGLVVGGLIFWRLWEHSETAWLIVVLLNAVMLLGMIGFSMPLGATFFFLLGNMLAQLLILFSPPVRAHVRTPSVTGMTSR